MPIDAAKLQPMPKRQDGKVLRVRGFVNPFTGYGLHAQYTAKWMTALGYTVELVPVGEADRPMPEVIKSLKMNPAEHRRELVIMPSSYKANAHQWFFTMYETTRLPLRHLKNVNGAHAVIVPSNWVAQCFNAQGVTAPIHVVPLGYNDFSFFPRCFAKEHVTFGTAGNPSVSVAERKNIEMVLEAFSLAFKNESDVRLKVKVLPDCLISSNGDERIEIIREVLPELEMGNWMRSLTAFVSASRGEAFGFFNVQAMACGVPVVTCNFGGVSDYFSESVGYPVDYELSEPHGAHYDTGLWAEPSLASLVEQMRYVYEHPDEAERKGWTAKDRAKAYTWEKAVGKLELVLRKSDFWESYKVIHSDSDEDRLRRFYRTAVQKIKGPMPDLANQALSNTPRGLGDTLLITHLPRAGAVQGKPRFVHANPDEHRHFSTLMKFNMYYLPKPTDYGVVMADELQKQADMGNGHFIQRLQRGFGLEPELRPKPYLDYPAVKVPNRVVMHFEAGGPHGAWQRVHIHPRARQLYPESRAVIQEFINQHPEMEFAQLGSEPIPFTGVRDLRESSLEDTIKYMATCEWFLGIISGPMHLASALRLKSIVVINFPPAQLIFLPTLVDIDQVESEWFYPQNVHLHQESAGPLVPKFSYRALAEAFEGKIYPYWSDRFLPLIHEKL